MTQTNPIDVLGDALGMLGQALDMESYEYLSDYRPYYLDAISHALAQGVTPAQIGQYVADNTTNGRSIAMTCEKAARHIQRCGEGAG
jgi:hypothetical protein